MTLYLWRSVCLCAGLGLGLRPGLAQDIQWLEEVGGEAYNLSGVGTVPVAALATGEVRLVFDSIDDQNYYCVRLAQERATFLRVQNGRTEEIGVSGSLLRLQPPEQLHFTLQRRPWQKVFVCNGLRTAWAEDGSLPPGRLGYGGGGPDVSISELLIQPVGDLAFADDFMRTGTPGEWEPLRGKWSVNTQGINVERSANAFSYKAETQGTALAVAGQPFWNDYLYEAAVRCDANGSVGLIVNFQDEQNYHLLRWSSRTHPDGGRLQLLRVFQGQSTELAQRSGGLEPHVWYKLRVGASGGHILAWIDDVLVFDLAEPFFGQGRIGLYAENTLEAPTAKERGALFDDALLRPWPLLEDDFSQAIPGRWRTVAGEWRRDPDHQWLTVGSEGSGGRSLQVTGLRDWSHYIFAADVGAERGEVGLICYFQDERHYLLFRWTGPGPEGRAQFVRVQEDTESVFAEVAGGYDPDGQRVQISAEDGYFAVTVEGKLLLDAVVPQVQGGGLGFYAAAAAGVHFDQVWVSFFPVALPPEPVVPAIFEKDPYMTAWANPRGEWISDGKETQWHKGFFFGDHRVAWTLPRGAQGAPATIAIGCPEGDFNSGYALTLQQPANTAVLQLTLRHQGVLLATTEVPLAPEATQSEVVLERRGNYLWAAVDGQKVLVKRLP